MRTQYSLHAKSLAATLERLDIATGDGNLDLSARIGRPERPGWIRSLTWSQTSEVLADPRTSAPMCIPYELHQAVPTDSYHYATSQASRARNGLHPGFYSILKEPGIICGAP